MAVKGNIDIGRFRYSSKLIRRIGSMMRKGEFNIEEIRNSDLYEKAKQEIGAEGFDQWVNEKINRLKKKIEKETNENNSNIGGIVNMSETTNAYSQAQQPAISMDMIKQAVNECLEGKCDLLNSVKQDLDGLKTQVMDLAKIKETLASNQSNDIQNEEITQPQIDLSQLAEQFKSLENTIKTTIEEIPKKTTSEFDGLSKAILNALVDIRNEISEKIDGASRKDEDIVPLDKALEDKNLQKKVLSDIERVAKKDKEFLGELSSLIQRCNLGDKEACEQVEEIQKQAQESKPSQENKPSENNDMLSKIEQELKQLSELRKKVESEMESVNKDIEEAKKEVEPEKGGLKLVNYGSPLRRLLGGKKG